MTQLPHYWTLVDSLFLCIKEKAKNIRKRHKIERSCLFSSGVIHISKDGIYFSGGLYPYHHKINSS